MTEPGHWSPHLVFVTIVVTMGLCLCTNYYERHCGTDSFIKNIDYFCLKWDQLRIDVPVLGWRPLMSLDCRIFYFIQVNPDTATFSSEEEEQVVGIHPLGSERLLMGKWLLTEWIHRGSSLGCVLLNSSVHLMGESLGMVCQKNECCIISKEFQAYHSNSLKWVTIFPLSAVFCVPLCRPRSSRCVRSSRWCAPPGGRSPAGRTWRSCSPRWPGLSGSTSRRAPSSEGPRCPPGSCPCRPRSSRRRPSRRRWWRWSPSPGATARTVCCRSWGRPPPAASWAWACCRVRGRPSPLPSRSDPSGACP